MTAKKTVKKAAKKAPSAPKLIDGIYSHVFNTRYKPEDGIKLEALKKHFNEKTYMGTIIRLLHEYLPLLLNLEDARKELKQCKTQMNGQATLLFSLKDNFKKIQDLKLVDIQFNDTGDCPECNQELDSDGDCRNPDCAYLR